MMSKTKAFLTLAVLFALGIGGGCQTASIDNADNEQITVRHFNEYASFEGEEDIIEEFPIAKVAFADDFKLWPDDPLNVYSYRPLEAADNLVDILDDYFGIDFTAANDLRYDGYVNYLYPSTDAENALGDAFFDLSTNYYTGKFVYGSSRSWEEIKDFYQNYAEYNLTKQRDLMQKSAVDFAQKFTDITGKLSLNHEEIIDMSDSIYNKTETTGYEYKGIKFYFTSSKSTTKLNLGDGTMCATENGVNDQNYFTVSVRPDGSIQYAENYLTMAEIEQSSQKPPLTREYLEKLSFLFTSTTENDTLVYDEISAYTYYNYFGYTSIEPAIHVKYHYESAPEETLETSFIYNLDWIE